VQLALTPTPFISALLFALTLNCNAQSKKSTKKESVSARPSLCFAAALRAPFLALNGHLSTEQLQVTQEKAGGWHAVSRLAYHGALEKAIEHAKQVFDSYPQKTKMQIVQVCSSSSMIEMLDLPEPKSGFLNDPVQHAMACFSVLGSTHDRSTDPEQRRKLYTVMERAHSVMSLYKLEQGREYADPRVLQWLTHRNGGAFATVGDVSTEDVNYCFSYY
jgi:hypothetical protein